MFLFVFYFQGAQGDSPITAGIKLMPMALGMLIASPLAGRYADRHGSRALAAVGMLDHRGRPGADDDAPGRQLVPLGAITLALVGIGSGTFMSPNTAAMMGAVPAHRRGIAAGARMVLQNTGSVLSIAFVLAIVTAAIPRALLFRIFSGLANGLSSREARALHPQHARRAVGARRRRRCSAPSSRLMRPKHTSA